MLRTRREGGFTLVELLVALALFAMLALILYAGVRDGVRATRTVDVRSDDRAAVVMAQRFLRDRLAGLGPAPGQEPDTGPAWFDGGASRLTVTAPWLETLPAAGIYRLEFAAGQEAGRPGALVFRWRPDAPEGGGEGSRATGERRILEGVRLLRFSYFGATDPGEAPAWYASWRSNGRAPELVRLEIEFDDPARSWPTLTVAIP